MHMPGRRYTTGSYRYGFQNQEKDDEIKGEGNSINFDFRVHDPRIGRFLSVDPLVHSYPGNSPYAFAENRVIDGIELEGAEWQSVKNGKGAVTDYKWMGYDEDGNAAEGTVASGMLKKNGTTYSYSSNAENQTGMMSVNNKTGNDVSIFFHRDGGATASLIDQSGKSTGYFEMGSGNMYHNPAYSWTYNRFIGMSGDAMYSQASKGQGFSYNLFASGGITAVYPEAYLVPLPKIGLLAKGLGIIGRLPGGPAPKAIAALGEWGEKRLAAYLGNAGSKPAGAYTTSMGNRFIDRLVNGVAHESKAGVNVKLTSQVRLQIMKDVELIQTNQIKGAHWHFFQGADKAVTDFLKSNKIPFTIHR